MASSDCSDMIAGIKGRKRKPRDGWDIYAWNMQKSVLTKRKNAVPAPHSFPSEAMKQEEHINVYEAKNHVQCFYLIPRFLGTLEMVMGRT